MLKLMLMMSLLCRAPHGARGLKYRRVAVIAGVVGRAPRGARGLKYPNGLCYLHTEPSRPSRGAWIEMQPREALFQGLQRRAPRGARGLK